MKIPIRSLVFITLALLAQIPSLGRKVPVREATLKVVVDEEFRHGYDGPSVLPRIIGRVSDRFHEKFGISFIVEEYGTWRSDNSRHTLFDMLDDLRRKTGKAGCDIVLGITGQSLNEGQYAGMASYMTGYVLLREPPFQALRSDVLEHELAHLFGAVDLREPGSIMDMARIGNDYNEFLERIISLNRERSFEPYVFPLSKSRRSRAIELYRERKHLWGDEPDVLIMLALLYLEEKQYAAVEKECLEILNIRPDIPEVHSLLGIALRRQGRLDEAIAEYNVALHYHEHNPEVYYNLGIALMKKGYMDEAIAAYRKAIELLPDHALALGNLGYIYLHTDQVDKAVLECRRSLGIYPKLPEVLSTLGAALIRKDQYAEAEEVSRQALSLTQNLAGPYLNLGSVFLHRGRAEAALDLFKTAQRLDPGASEVHYNLGRAYLRKKDLPSARMSFQKALEINPGYHQALANLSAVHIKLEQYAEAEEAARSAVKIAPEYQVAYLNLARALSETHRCAEAEVLCRKALALHPEKESHNLLGYILEKQGKLEKALDAYSSALEIDAEFVEPLIRLGDLNFKLKRYPESSRHYLAAVNLEPQHPEVYNNLAVIYYYRQDFQKAWEYMIKAEELGMSVHADFKASLREKIKKTMSLLT